MNEDKHSQKHFGQFIRPTITASVSIIVTVAVIIFHGHCKSRRYRHLPYQND